MGVNFTQLHCKEVICISDGRRLGFISDARVELPEGKLTAIIVPCPCRIFGIMGPKDDYVIPWCRIKQIGPDIVLVDVRPEDCRVPRHKPRLLF